MLVKLGSKFKFMFINCKAYWKWWTPISNELMFTMFINFYLLSNNNFEILVRNDSPKLFTNASHIVRNSFWIKKNWEVTMKANFIHIWSVEYEFITKNQFHNWTSKDLAHFYKIGLFFALFECSSTGILFLSPDAACTGALEKTQT